MLRQERQVAFFLLLLGGAVAFVAGGSRSAKAVDDEAVVARIGERKVLAGTVKKALAGIPPFELQSLGGNKLEILRKYVDEAIVREELLAEAGRLKGAPDDRSVQYSLAKSLAGALVRKEIEALGTRDSIPDAEVRAYYDAHIAEYKTPERIRLWHLVTSDKAAADAALAKINADPTRESWGTLVSTTSLDPNTKYSNGDLGFVSADGATTQPKVVVPKELVNPAFALKDGAIAPMVVKSAAGWHVLWRRGSVPPTVRTYVEESPTIRQLLFEQKREKTYKALVERLRVERKVEIDEELLQVLPLVTIDVGPRPVPKK